MSYQARKPIENDEERRHASAIASASSKSENPRRSSMSVVVTLME